MTGSPLSLAAFGLALDTADVEHTARVLADAVLLEPATSDVPLCELLSGTRATATAYPSGAATSSLDRSALDIVTEDPVDGPEHLTHMIRTWLEAPAGRAFLDAFHEDGGTVEGGALGDLAETVADMTLETLSPPIAPARSVPLTLRGLVAVAQEAWRADLQRFAASVDQLVECREVPAPHSASALAREVGERDWQTLLGSVTEREGDVLFRRTFSREGKPTLDDLGQEYGITRERVRQIENQALKRLTSLLTKSSGLSIALLAESVFEALGPVCTADALEVAIDCAVRETSDADDLELDRRTAFLHHLVGPWVDCFGLLHHAIAMEVVDRALRDMPAEDDGTVLPTDVVAETRTRLGLDAGLDAHLERLLNVRRFGDALVRWPRSMNGRAAAYLTVRGEATTFDDIHEALGFDVNPRSLGNAMANDPRLARLGRQVWGLRSWGHEEYEGIATELEQALSRAGGPLPLEQLIDDFVDRFGVAPSSVRSYAAGRQFVQLPDGLITLRTAEHGEASVRPGSPALTPGLVLIDGRWHLRMEIDHDSMRGSGRMIRAATAFAAGLEPDLIFRVEYAGGGVTFTWRRNQPSIGSVRALVIEAGGAIGDLLFLPLAGDEPRRSLLVRAVELEAATGPERLALNLGQRGLDAVEQICRALDLPAGADLWDAIDRLADRGEQALLELLPEHMR